MNSAIQPSTKLQPHLFRVAFVGGGTGGHLVPAIALAQEFARLVPDTQVRFLIPGKPLEKELLRAHGFSYEVCGGRAPVGGIVARLKSAYHLSQAYRRCLRSLRENRPNVVIGVGGYGSVCGGLAARRLGIPLLLLEQNVVAGRVNRLMSRFAETLFAQWPLMRDVPGKKARVSVRGNPIRRSIGRYERDHALRLLDLDPDRTTLMIAGGSQGAEAVNDAILDHLSLLEERWERLQVIHLTGGAHFDALRGRWAHSRVRHCVFPFVTETGPLVAAADVVLCRAGATTISELTAFGKPMILVPLPTAMDDHQALNAGYVAAHGAATVVHQNDLKNVEVMTTLLDETILNPLSLQAMAAAAQSLGRLGAGKSIALSILERFGVEYVQPTATDGRFPSAGAA